MNCPHCDWTAEHIHHDRPPAAPRSVTRQGSARRHDTPIVAAGTTTLLDSIIDRLAAGAPVIWRLSPPVASSPG